MHLLVTGGAGFPKSYLCDRLLDQRRELICADNFYTSSRRNIRHQLNNSDFEVVCCDVTFLLFLEGAAVYNLACPASSVRYHHGSVQFTETSVPGAINMVVLATRLNILIPQASTSEVYGNPEVNSQQESYWGCVNPIGPHSCYGESKRCAEILFVDYYKYKNVAITVARIFNIYGPRMQSNNKRVVSNFIVQALRSDPITIYGDGTQSRSYCYVDDLIDGLMRLMNSHPNVTGPIKIGKPNEFTIAELANMLGELTGSRSAIERPQLQDDPQAAPHEYPSGYGTSRLEALYIAPPWAGRNRRVFDNRFG